MSDDPNKTNHLDRRDFIKTAGAGAGLILLGDAARAEAEPVRSAAVRSGASPDIVVIGAGIWGSFTAYHLRKMGANVTLVDAYGPGNARSTSGDETRGVRSSYGDRVGALGELWMLWAREAMTRWIAFDDEWGREMRLNLFHVTGDLILRDDWDNFQLRCKLWWDRHKIPYAILAPDDVRRSFPVIGLDDITAVLYEPDAGVVRARRAVHAVAAAYEKLGGKIIIGRATPLKSANGKLEAISLDTGTTLRADTFVYAVGPWLGKTFPDLFAKKTRVPIGYVCYFATPSATIGSPILICRASISPVSPDGPRCRWIIADSACAAPSAYRLRQAQSQPPDRRARTSTARRRTPVRISPTPAPAPGRVVSKPMSRPNSRTQTRATAGCRPTASRARDALWRIASRC